MCGQTHNPPRPRSRAARYSIGMPLGHQAFAGHTHRGRSPHALLGLLSSSTACFWLKSGSPHQGSSKDDKGRGSRPCPALTTSGSLTGTQLGSVPPPRKSAAFDLARQLEALAHDLAEQTPARVLARWDGSSPLAPLLANAHAAYRRIRGRMIALQEDLDWQCYPPLRPN